MGKFLTKNGYEKLDFSSFLTILQKSMQLEFGMDIDLSLSSAWNKFAGIFSEAFANLWEATEELYFCRNPDRAQGYCLDAICIENGIKRLPATYTQINDVFLSGVVNTIISAGKKIAKINDSITYSLSADVTLSQTKCRATLISVVNVTIGATYTITIDSINYNYVCIGGDTKTTILTSLKTLIDLGAWDGVATVGNEKLTLTKTTVDFSFDISVNLKIEEISSIGNFICDSIGAINVSANTLTVIITPVTGWERVINYSAGIPGRNVQSDDELRIFREQSIILGNGTEASIASRIISNVANVTFARVISNRTDLIDSDGRPPHSFETIVVGGTNSDVAKEIWTRMATGINTFGNVNGGAGIVITDSQNVPQTIKFSRPENVYIFVKIKRNFNTEEIYPTNGDELIKNAIISWSLETKNISIGVDVIRQKLSIPVYTVPGIKDIEILLDKSLTLPFCPVESAINITISARQIAVFSIDRIVVEILS